MKLSRRSVLSAMAAPVAIAIPTAAANETGAVSAEDRLRHHLAMASQAMHELVADPGRGWWISAHGNVGKGTAGFLALRYDLTPDGRKPGSTIETEELVSEGWL